MLGIIADAVVSSFSNLLIFDIVQIMTGILIFSLEWINDIQL